MSSAPASAGPSVVVVGGGLAGLAAAVGLASSGCRVELFEARSSLGGRATSFRDPATGELVDHCQHVGMGCCTNLADFCRRTGTAGLFRRDRVVNFVGPDDRVYRLCATRWLPAPLHLVPSFFSLRYLSLRDRIGIARGLWKLMRSGSVDAAEQSIGQWLNDQGQSTSAIEQFWSVILTSALGEDLERASLSAARKVLVDGFLAAREAYELEIPEAPLGFLYGQRLVDWLADHQVDLHLGSPVRQVTCESGPVVHCEHRPSLHPDFVVLAVPWNKVGDILAPEIAASWPWLEEVSRLDAAPITGVHLWFDGPITPLPHAVLVGRLSQWIFNRGRRDTGDHGGYYYQVVISASRELAGRDRREVVAEVCGELAAIWPAAATARLLHARVVTDHAAVVSPRPLLDRLRPPQQSATPGIVLAGDWTATGWPATMESAVRSGYLAAEAILRSTGRGGRWLTPDLPRGFLARRLIKA